MSITEAQTKYLSAWRKSHPNGLANACDDLGVPHDRPLDEWESSDANAVIAAMVATFGEPKEGNDAERHSEDPEHKGDGDGEGDTEGNGEGEGDGEGDDRKDNPYREGSKENLIAQALAENDLDPDATFDDLKEMIGEDPLIFKGNNGGKREPLPMGSVYDKSSDKTQNGRCKKTINDVRRNLLNEGIRAGDRFKSDECGTPDPDGEGEGKAGSKSEPQPPLHELEMLLAQINKAREICEQMNADGEPFDTVGMRPYVHAPKMFHEGFPVPAIIDAMTMTWPKEVRRELNGGADLPTYDQTRHSAGLPDTMPLDEIEARLRPLAEKTGGKSLYLPALVSLAKIGVPILQVGEKGTGKTTNAEHLAAALADLYDREMPFGFASMTSGTSPGEFKGRITLDGFLPSQFEAIYESGGVYLFDELDAGDENLLTLLNSALANGRFVNQKGQIIEQHERFVPVAAANTMGLGATSRYTGRNRLDAATLDRWAMGRVRVDFDQNLAEYIFWRGALDSATV